LADTIANDLSQDADTPLAPTLQILLTKLWDAARQRDPQRPRFDQALYRELKSQGVLLGDFVDQQLAGIENDNADPAVLEAARRGLLLDVLVLHTTVLGTSNQVMRHELDRTYGQRLDVLPALLAECVDRYLLTVVEGRDRTTATRLAHDTLGPIIRQRFEESDRDGQRAHRILDARVDEWQSGNRVPLDDADLVIVERGKDGGKAWTDTERDLIEASRRAHHRRKRLRYAIVSAGIVMLLAIVSSAATAVYFGRQADLQRQDADAQRKRTEESLAASWLAPLPMLDIRSEARFRQQAVGAGEFQAIWDLAQTDNQRLRWLFLETAVQSEFTAKQLVSRRDMAVLASVGLNEELRQQVLAELVRPRLDDPNSSWSTVVCGVAIGSALAGDRETFQSPAARAIMRTMQKTEDPVELAWLGDALVQVKGAADPNDVLVAFQRLLRAIDLVPEDSYPALLGESMAEIADALPGQAALPMMNAVLSNWKTKNHLAVRRDLESAVCRIAAGVEDHQVAATVRLLIEAISVSDRLYGNGFGETLGQVASRLSPVEATEIFPLVSNALAQAAGPPIYGALSVGWIATAKRLAPATRRQFLGDFLREDQEQRSRRLPLIESVADAISSEEAAELLVLLGAPPPPGSDPAGTYASYAVALGKRCESAAAADALQAILASAPYVQQLAYESPLPAEMEQTLRLLLERIPAAELGPAADQLVASIAAPARTREVQASLLASLASIPEDDIRQSAVKRAWESTLNGFQQASETNRGWDFAGALRQLAPQLGSDPLQAAAGIALSEYERMHAAEIPEWHAAAPWLECFAVLDPFMDRETSEKSAAAMMKVFRSSLAPARFPRDSLRRELVKTLTLCRGFSDEDRSEVVAVLTGQLSELLTSRRADYYADVLDSLADLAPRLSAAQQNELHQRLWPAIPTERNHARLAAWAGLWYMIAPQATRDELAGEVAARLIAALHDPPSAALAGRGGTMSQSHVLGEIASVLSMLAEHLDPPHLLGGSEAVMVALLSPDFRESHTNLTDCLRALAGRLDKFALVNMLKWPVCIAAARTVVLDG
jgi:hypothetical protein